MCKNVFKENGNKTDNSISTERWGCNVYAKYEENSLGEFETQSLVTSRML